MFQITQAVQASGEFLEACGQGIIRCVPKLARATAANKLRPIVLQQVKKKWFVPVLPLQIEDVLLQITPTQQVRCFKRQHMQEHTIQHIWNVRGEWTTEESMILLIVGYRNTF